MKRTLSSRAVIVCAAMGVVLGGGLGQGGEDGFVWGQPVNQLTAERTVYVDDSTEAADRLDQAQRLARLGDWSKAAELFQDVIDTLGQKLIQEESSDQDAPQQQTSDEVMVSVSEHARKLLLEWPEAGVEAYRSRYNTKAQEMLKAVREKMEGAGAWGAAGVGSGAGEGETAAALLDICRRYFLTETAAEAAGLLQEILLRQGHYGSAVVLGEDVLASHPDVRKSGSELRAMWLFRTALAWHMSGGGSTGKGAGWRDELVNGFADAQGRVFGRDVNLADAIVEMMSAGSGPKARGTGLDTWAQSAWGSVWPTYLGSQDRGRTTTAGGKPTARLATVVFPSQTDDVLAREDRLRGGAVLRLQRGGGGVVVGGATAEQGSAFLPPVGPFPVLDGSTVYVNDGKRIYAIDIESGLPPAGWAATYPGDSLAAYVYGRRSTAAQVNLMGMLPMVPQQATTMSVWGDKLLAVMGQAIPAGFRNQSGSLSTDALVCVDKYTGRKLWTSSPREWPARAGGAKDLWLTGTPVVIGNRIFVMARGSKANQFEDAYLICLDENGQFQWVRYLASSAILNPWGERVTNVSGGDISAHEDRLIISTDVGVVASVNAHDGQVEWLVRYDRPTQAMDGRRMQPMFQARQAGGIEAGMSIPQPAVVRREKEGATVFVLPSDGQELLVLSAATGEVQRAFSFADLMLDRQPPTHIIGVDDLGRVYLGYRKGVACVQWRDEAGDGADEAPAATPQAEREVQAGAGAKEQGKPRVLWTKVFASPISGRGQLTQVETTATDSGGGQRSDRQPAGLLMVPTQQQLFLIDAAGGKTMQIVPAKGNWPENEGQGNVLIAPDHVVMSSSSRLNIYTDLMLARVRFEKQLRETPGHLPTRLRYAELLMAGGLYAEGLNEVEQIIGLLGGAGSMREGTERQRLFQLCLASALRLSEFEGEQQEQYQLLMQKAMLSASTAGESVEVRRQAAVVAQRQGRLAEQVRLLHEILSNAGWRQVRVVSGAEDQMLTAGRWATRELRESRRAAASAGGMTELLANYSNQAKAELGSGKSPAEVMELAVRYPLFEGWASVLEEAALKLLETGKGQDAMRVMDLAVQMTETGLTPLNGARQTGLASGKEEQGGLADLQAKAAEVRVRGMLLSGRGTLDEVQRMNGALHASTMAMARFAGHVFEKPIDGLGGNFAEVTGVLSKKIDEAGERSLADVKLPLHGELTGSRNASGRVYFGTPEALGEKVERLIEWTTPDGRPAGDGLDLLVQTTEGGVERLELADLQVKKRTALGQFSAEKAAKLGDNGELFAAWDVDDLHVFSGADNKLLWRMRVSTLPEPGVSEPEEEVMAEGEMRTGQAGDTAAGGQVDLQQEMNPQNQFLEQQRRQIRINRFLVQQALRQQGAQQVGVREGDPERIRSVAGVRVQQAGGEDLEAALVMTSEGRMLMLDAKRGSVLWQKRLTEGQVLKQRVNTLYATVLTTHDNMTHLDAIELASGRHIGRWKYEVNGDVALIDHVLTGDGWLVVRHSDRLLGVHLGAVAAGGEMGWNIGSSSDPTLVVNDNAADSLEAVGGKIALVHSAGGRLRFFQFSDTDPNKLEADAQDLVLGAIGDTDRARFMKRGVRLFGYTRQFVFSASAIDPADRWMKNLGTLRPVLLGGLTAGKDYLLAVDQLAMDRKGGKVKLHGLNRERISPGGRETGLWLFSTELPVGVLGADKAGQAGPGGGMGGGFEGGSMGVGMGTIRGVDGGLVVLDEKRKLWLIKGARP